MRIPTKFLLSRIIQILEKISSMQLKMLRSRNKFQLSCPANISPVAVEILQRG
ncbi:hypothetical protein EVA_01636 [gut metagenome]|uniref:Uncharacterized protein n=1 Tax=gut metagenome TaxID=749906 RepID=J9DBF2_9ZZZZ